MKTIKRVIAILVASLVVALGTSSIANAGGFISSGSIGSYCSSHYTSAGARWDGASQWECYNWPSGATVAKPIANQVCQYYGYWYASSQVWNGITCVG